MMVDTHTHLYLPEFNVEDGGAGAVCRAINLGVEKMIFPNVDLSTIEPMTSLAAKFPDNVKCAMGLHPTEIKENWFADLDKVMEYIKKDNKYVAVGEIGIDLYWDKAFRDAQMQAFDIQCKNAVQLGLPVIIHCREGLDEVLEVLEAYPDIRGVFHSFGGDEADVERIRKIGDFYFGINGIVTFKNSRLREILPSIGLGRVLLETDSPYLAPVPFRGKRNESTYLPYICAHIAAQFELETSIVAEITTKNAATLFMI